MQTRHPIVRLAAVLWFGGLAAIAGATVFKGGTHDGFSALRTATAPDYPQVQNVQGATNVTALSAWLNGMLLHAGGTAQAGVSVFWGTTDGGTDPQAWGTPTALGNADPYNPLSVQVTVEPGKTYFYRFYASNTLDRVGWAAVSATFETPAPPIVSTGAGAGMGIVTADLNGELTSGLEAGMWLDWGATDLNVPPASATTIDLGLRSIPGTLAAPNPFRIRLSGLTASSVYAYRVRAENADGDATSAWVWFTTRPADFGPTAEPAGFSGGDGDGYDAAWRMGEPMPGSNAATLLILR